MKWSVYAESCDNYAVARTISVENYGEKMTEKNTNFDEIIERRNTDCLKYDFAVQRGKPKDILPLWVADMDFKTSSIVLDKIRERVEHGIFGYTETGDNYFEALNSWFVKNHDLHIEKQWVVQTPGVVFAIASAIKALTDEGDAVLISQPVYYPFAGVIRDNNRRAVSSDLVLCDDNKYRIDFDDFEKKIVENKIKLFVLCNPHNPVGRVWTRDELLTLIDICLRNDVIIFSDEIHSDFIYDGYKHIPLINVDERIKEHCIIATAPTKTFNLAGLQISNIIIPNEKIRKKIAGDVYATGYSEANTIGVVACEAAYRYGQEWYEELKKYLKGNLDFVRDYLQRELPQIKLIEPEGTYLIWLDFRALSLCERELEDLMVNKAGIWLDSGLMFGKTGAGFERVNIATSRAVLKEALDRIKAAVNELDNDERRRQP